MKWTDPEKYWFWFMVMKVTGDDFLFNEIGSGLYYYVGAGAFTV